MLEAGRIQACVIAAELSKHTLVWPGPWKAQGWNHLMVLRAVWPLSVWSPVLCSSAAGKALFGFLDDITVAQGQLSACFDSK